MGSKLLKAEGILRLLTMVLASLSALLAGLDSETESVFFMQRKATVKDLDPLWVLTIIAWVVAGFQLLQLCRCFACAWLAKNPCERNKVMAWICFLLDQGSTYLAFAGTVAATQASAVAVFGVNRMQWSKLCNIYTRFCYQIGGSVVCGLAASATMAVVSSISAHHLFQLYPSPNHRSSVSVSVSGGRRWGLL